LLCKLTTSKKHRNALFFGMRSRTYDWDIIVRIYMCISVIRLIRLFDVFVKTADMLHVCGVHTRLNLQNIDY